MQHTTPTEAMRVRALYKHKLDTLRGEVRNIADATMPRRIHTALAALTAQPTPNLAVVQEQLEMLLLLANELTTIAQPPT